MYSPSIHAKRSRRFNRVTILTGAIAAAATLIAPAGKAAEINWLGGAAGGATDFNLGANWLGGNLPALYNEVTNNINGDVAVFDGTQAGVINKTPTMTAAFGSATGGNAAGSSSETWGLLGMIFKDSGWTFSTGASTLAISHRNSADLRSEATSGVNTINGTLRFGARDTNDFSHIYVEAGGTLRLNANIGTAIDGGGNASGGPEKRGAGTLELNTTGTFGSGLRVFEGTVRLFAETAGGITGNGTGGLGVGSNLTLNIVGGTVDVNGATTTLNAGTLVLGASATLTNGSATAETVSTKAFSSQTLAGLISGNLSMSFGANANATTTITNNNSYTGTTTITNSTGSNNTTAIVVTQSVMPNANSPLGNSSSAIVLGSTGSAAGHAALLTNGAIEIGRDITVGASTSASGLKTIGAADTQVGNSTFSGTITVGTASQANLTVTAPTGVTVGITGNIVEHSAVGNGGLMKIGAGTVSLSGDNTYAGNTAVNAGILLVNNTIGSGTGTGAITVAASGTLGGTGTIAPSGSNGLSVSGILAPGAGLGTLKVDLTATSGTLSILSGGGFKFELGAAGADIGTAGTSDRLSLIGASALDVAFNGNTIDFSGTGAEGWYKLFDTDLASDSTWSGLTLSGQKIESGLSIANLGIGLTGELFLGNGAMGDTDDIYLHVVPEPTAATALIGGIGVLLGSLRRRRQA